jgi:hypothetical protein
MILSREWIDNNTMNNAHCLSQYLKQKQFMFKSTYETEMYFIKYLTLRDIDKKLYNKRIEKRKLTSSFVRFLLTEKTFESLNEKDIDKYNIHLNKSEYNDPVLPNYSCDKSNEQFKNDLLQFGLTIDEFNVFDNYIKNKIYNTHTLLNNIASQLPIDGEYPSVNVEIDINFKKVTFKYDTYEYYIHMNIYKKLCSIYHKQLSTFKQFEQFNLDVLYVLFIYCGVQGYGYQRSSCKLHRLPPNSYFELFASPLNIEHPFGYCSAFPHIEYKFGSYGSFFNVLGKEESLNIPCNIFVINPPFINTIFEILNNEINVHMNMWNKSERNCEILYYSAYWDDFEPLVQLTKSKYVTHKEIKPVDYFDHNTTKVIKSKFDSVILHLCTFNTVHDDDT